MKSETNKNVMDKFFNVESSQPNISQKINDLFLSMSTDIMIETIQQFGLDPIYAYLDFSQIRGQNPTWNIHGFVTYIDNYLIENSGGKRSKLNQLGYQIMGRYPTAFSMRMIRMELISFLLSQQLKQQ